MNEIVLSFLYFDMILCLHIIIFLQGAYFEGVLEFSHLSAKAASIDNGWGEQKSPLRLKIYTIVVKVSRFQEFFIIRKVTVYIQYMFSLQYNFKWSTV